MSDPAIYFTTEPNPPRRFADLAADLRWAFEGIAGVRALEPDRLMMGNALHAQLEAEFRRRNSTPEQRAREAQANAIAAFMPWVSRAEIEHGIAQLEIAAVRTSLQEFAARYPQLVSLVRRR